MLNDVGHALGQLHVQNAAAQRGSAPSPANTLGWQTCFQRKSEGKTKEGLKENEQKPHHRDRILRVQHDGRSTHPLSVVCLLSSRIAFSKRDLEAGLDVATRFKMGAQHMQSGKPPVMVASSHLLVLRRIELSKLVLWCLGSDKCASFHFNLRDYNLDRTCCPLSPRHSFLQCAISDKSYRYAVQEMSRKER